MNRNEKLKALIRNSQQALASSLIPLIDLSTTQFVIREERKAIPIQQVLDIYRVRAKVNEAYRSGINGFKELIPNLEQSASKFVAIHEMFDEGYAYYLFTDPTLSELIGVLEFPGSGSKSI